MSAPPKRLGRDGAALWKRVHDGLPPGWGFTETEVEHLLLACQTADVVARLERKVKRDGDMLRGSTAQPIPHPLIAECRRQREAISRELRQIDLPEPEQVMGSAPTTASERGRKAAQARWSREATKKSREVVVPHGTTS